MKKLENLKINPKNLIKNEEMITLRGGYDGNHMLKCFADGRTCGTHVETCDDPIYLECMCDWGCPTWWGLVCV